MQPSKPFVQEAPMTLTPDREAWARINYVKILHDDAVAKDEYIDYPYWLFEANIMKLHLTAKKIIEDREANITEEIRTESGVILPGSEEIKNVLEKEI